MKRSDLIRHLQSHGCRIRREGGNHTIYQNPATGQGAPVSRHREIGIGLARHICR